MELPDALQDGRGYPRPLLRRREWRSLNGPWDFAWDVDAIWTHPDQVAFAGTIVVPFSPETPASGAPPLERARACWYRRTVAFAPPAGGERLWLHFGAVDYAATVWANGVLVGAHEGGYTPFAVELTHAVADRADCVLVVRAHDDASDMSKPRGKQSWRAVPHSIWYPRTTGIWQTVWTEHVPATWIERLRWTPNLERWELGLEVWLRGQHPDQLDLQVELRDRDTVIASDVYRVFAGVVQRRIALSDPGIDDFRNELLWNPARPTLLDATLRLQTPAGEVLDEVTSYAALRTVGIDGDRFMLNGRAYPLRLVLDQGYWPETGMTAPDDQALERDVALVKAMGFNGVRKHQKIEDPRFLYWADRLGLFVWEEMPSAHRFTPEGIERVTAEWIAAIARDISHPCIVAWVPFNESWGVPNLPAIAAERHYVQALYHLTKTLDPTRPVVGNDGWESVTTDIVGIHDYDSPARLSGRYQTSEGAPRLFARERPAGRVLVLGEHAHANLPVMLTEFGGVTFAEDEASTWGYWRVRTAQEFADRYRALMRAVHGAGIFAGFCYTQFADTYQEANGLLYADRRPKVPLALIAAATRGEGLAETQAVAITDVHAPADQA